MSMATNKEKSLSSILGTDGQPLERVQRSDPEHFGTARSSLQAARGYDLLTNQYNGDNWHNAVRLDGNSVNDKETLQRLRDLARGEKRNNPHMAGLIHKVTNETVGTGPRLSIEPVRPSDRSMRAASRVEQLWEASVNEMKLLEKLRLMCEERVTAGESFGVVESNRMLTIPVDIRVYEGEQFCSPSFGRFSGDGYQDDVDGIQFDRDGNATLTLSLFGTGLEKTGQVSIEVFQKLHLCWMSTAGFVGLSSQRLNRKNFEPRWLAHSRLRLRLMPDVQTWVTSQST
jgi:hypothetical protein